VWPAKTLNKRDTARRSEWQHGNGKNRTDTQKDKTKDTQHAGHNGIHDKKQTKDTQKEKQKIHSTQIIIINY